MPYVDTNVFIYPLIYEEKLEKARLAKRILLKIARGELEAFTSSITWDELVWVLRRFKGMDVARSEGRKFLRFPNLKFLTVNDVIEEAQRLIEKYDIRPRDAIHVACALKNRIKEIISEDSELDVIKEIRRIGIHEVAV